MKSYALIPLLMLLMAVIRPERAEGPAKTVYRQEPDCLECHGDLLDREVVHPVAADACDNCHMPTGATHPGSDSAGFTLMDRLPDLCFYCHEGPLSPASGHEPVQEGACLDCHDVHASSEYRLLTRPEVELCLTCHGGEGSGSGGSADIRSLVTGTCLPHSAIPGGGCISCHLAHGSEQRALLAAAYPEENYPAASVENFELCFLCHDTDLLEAVETEWATGFRDGAINLHQLHIRGAKGRNCRLCHNLHGSTQPYLMAEKVPFGSWQMEIRFTPSGNGGSCQPGCHRKESYERNE